MTWFERLMGFPEVSLEQVRANIEHRGEHLISRVNGRRVRCGRLAVPSLAELRMRVGELAPGPLHVREVVGDVGVLHRDPAHAGALFQAASQFNLLEMVAPHVTPERGVGVACGGGTILRNYFVEVDGQPGQTAARQLDCLAELGVALGGPGLWEMRNGYALAHAEGLARAGRRLAEADEAERDRLRGLLRIGVQHDVEVLGRGHVVTQVYGSAMPVAYGAPPTAAWEPLARLVLEASYEATLLVARESQLSPVFLTFLGGGVFGNPDGWIAEAMVRAVRRVPGLDVRLVSYGRPSPLAARVVDGVSSGGATASRR